jgi:hypothetical protein
MPPCAFCGQEVIVRERVMMKDECPHCRRDLHCCLQCRFHDPAYHNQCREPKADPVRDRDKMNLCDYFEFGAAPCANDLKDDQAKQKIESLFKKK